MKDNLQFRVSAELKNILGRDLITSPDIAILELVKNSYDAHASKVEITFDDDGARAFSHITADACVTQINVPFNLKSAEFFSIICVSGQVSLIR